ncbi:MAG: protein kinase [Myxococcales bacterium]|nr:protein kinase [Myxococcales bacterium]
MSTPAPRHFCPRCRASYPAPQAFCSECGTDMLRVSAIDLASARDAALGETRRVDAPHVTRADRRINASNQAWLGTIVDGRYRVLEVIGRGGMGVVYKVEHVRMGKIAAMKVLHRDLADDPDVVQRFEREAAAVSRLQHPNAVQVFDFGAAQGALYLIMEYVRGQDLGSVVDRDGPLPFARVAPLVTQILGALTEAHELGIVHRDLKPDNVLVTRTTGGRDFAKVLDFGLAKLAHAGAPDVSDQGQIVGTPYFMAPEQIRGDDVDARTDVYAMGALMYRLVTGTYVFTAATAVGVLTKHLTAEVEPPSRRAPDAGIAPELDDLILRALAKDPAARWASATAMAAAIDEAYGLLVGDRASLAASRALPGSSRPRARALTEDDEPLSELRLRRSDLDRYERSLRRGRWLAVVAVLAVLAALAAGAAWWFMWRTAAPVRAEREPNDTPAQANRIAVDTTVTGLLGRRRSPSEPDVDVYRLPRRGPGALTIALTAVPNIDVTLTVRDGAGLIVASADEQAVGGDEHLYARRVTGPVTIEVGQAMTTALPIENVSDRYRLDVRVAPDDPAWEREPNGDRSDAAAVAPSATVRGRLEARTDVDALRWTGPAGPVVVEVAAPDELPLSWRGPDGTDRAPGRATMTLATDDVITLRRRDRDAAKGPLPGAEATWAVTMIPAP